MWVEFLITSLIVVIAPGTGVVYTIGIGLARGARASVVAAAGCTCGILPHIVAAVLGVAALLQASAVAFQVFKLVGVAYLFYLAWATLREKGAFDVSPDGDRKPLLHVGRTGFLINILNPKLSIFFLAFLPQFLPADAEMPLARMLVLSAIFMAMTFVVFVLYGVFASVIRSRVVRSPRILGAMRWAFATAFVLLGVRLLMERV
jgi:threonine/homoserine/homoserine lactone efflux protein